jgi:hypothetical protein
MLLVYMRSKEIIRKKDFEIKAKKKKEMKLVICEYITAINVS